MEKRGPGTTAVHGGRSPGEGPLTTPFLQRPLALGADLVMHSLTKALAGHSDVVGGALAGSRERIDRARDTMKAFGGCLDPRAASLGGVESLVSVPVHTSHHGLDEAGLREAGIDPGMVRVSAGVEDSADLIADLQQALEH